jgi:hypothetical protein
MAGQGYGSPLTNGLTILPSPTTFTAYSLIAGTTTQLQWATDNFPANSNVLAELMNITPLGTGCTLQMPAATNTSLGEKALVFNSGSTAFTVADNLGNTIASINPGAAIYFALTNNLTANGTWLTFQFGAGTSAANAAALAGAGLSANGPFLQQVMAVTTLNAAYTVGVNDRDNLLNWVGGAGTITLPAALAVGSNFYIQVRNSGSGTLTIAPNGSDLINGANSLSMNVNDSCFLVTDGTGWWTIGLGSINTNIFNFQVVNLAGQSGTYVLPSNLQNKVAYRFTGALAGNTNIQVPTTVQQYWVDNQTSGGTLGIGTSAQISGSTQFTITSAARFILYCDGTNVVNAATAGIGIPLAVSQGGTGATTPSNALTNLGGTTVGVAVFTAANQAAAQSALGVLSSEDSTIWGIIF